MDEEEAGRLGGRIGDAKAFLETLQAYTTPGRLKNFRHDAAQVAAQQSGLDALAEVEALDALCKRMSQTASYLSTASAGMPPEHPWTTEVTSAREEVLAEFQNPAERTQAAFRQRTERRLNGLKKDYIQAYLADHAKARLGVNADRRKTELLQDDRLVALHRLSAIELMPSEHLHQYQDRLVALKSCFELREAELSLEPFCPHCGFKPGAEASASVENVLGALDAELDKHTDDWTRTLLTNLNASTTQDALELLKDDSRKLVEEFAQQGRLPEKIEQDFIEALNEALGGLQRVTVTADGLRRALLAGGTPATPMDIRQRFEGYLGELTKGMDAEKVRILVD